MSAAAPVTTAQPAAPDAVAPASVAPDWAVLGDILARSLEELVAAGRVHAACSLAGLACAATRGTDIRTWKRFNALLHRWSARAPEPVPPHDERSPPAR
ncbi:MAG: hypothetical protein M9945_00390 [Aquamicrobium sp.]|uniref:hypothetical protein n=1 Tax=Aquamicrobium sp. TaxID=1872579 RepID=UPI00349E8D35|nr:hypothetical protein [Aquamicrobium sp.]